MGNLQARWNEFTLNTMYQVSPAVEAGERGNVCADGNPCSVPDVLFCGAFGGNKALKIRVEALSPAVRPAGGVECNFCAGHLGECDPGHTTTDRYDHAFVV